jgi:hypothetical protein
MPLRLDHQRAEASGLSSGCFCGLTTKWQDQLAMERPGIQKRKEKTDKSV